MNLPIGTVIRVQISDLDWYLPLETWNDFRTTLRDLDGFVGVGRDKVVIRHQYNHDKVVSVFHQPREWLFLMESLGVHRILHNLFPHNFPNCYGFFGYNFDHEENSDEAKAPFYYSGFISDFIRGKMATDVNKKLLLVGTYYDYKNFMLSYPGGKNSGQDVQYPMQKVLDIAERIGFPILKLGFDPFPENFILGEDGGEYYVDYLKGPYYSDPHNYAHWWQSEFLMANIEKEIQSGALSLTKPQKRQVEEEISILG